MALGLGNGEFTPFVKYNAKSGRWSIRKDKKDVEVPAPTFVADMSHIRTGWFYLRDGAAPEKIYHKSRTEKAPRPDRKWTDNGKEKLCFMAGAELNLFSPKFFDGVVEFLTTSFTALGSLDELDDAYIAGVVANPGKLPVVECASTEPVKGDYGINYKPIFKITGWVDAPAELQEYWDKPVTDVVTQGAASANQASAAQAQPAQESKSASNF